MLRYCSSHFEDFLHNKSSLDTWLRVCTTFAPLHIMCDSESRNRLCLYNSSFLYVEEFLGEITFCVDVPVLTVDCDIVDPTINSEEEIGEKLEQFFELLEDR